jgi:hypothetical protein
LVVAQQQPFLQYLSEIPIDPVTDKSGNVVNKEQIPKEGAKGPEHLLDLWYPEP